MTRTTIYRRPATLPAALRDLETHLNRVFSDARPETAAWQPRIDLTETADAYVIHADVPGVTKEDVDIEVHGDTVTLRGERKREALAEDASRRHTERGHGRFERTFRLPEHSIDAERVEARYHNGVLTLTVPKRAEAKAREIPVTFE